MGWVGNYILKWVGVTFSSNICVRRSAGGDKGLQDSGHFLAEICSK